MPVVQATIVCAVSVLGDSLGFSTRAAGVQTSGRFAYMRSEGRSVPGFSYTQAVPRRRISGSSCKPHSICFNGRFRSDRSTQLKQDVSFCHKSARRKICRGLLMEGFLRDMQ
jgi:hypothetical protein